MQCKLILCLLLSVPASYANPIDAELIPADHTPRRNESTTKQLPRGHSSGIFDGFFSRGIPSFPLFPSFPAFPSFPSFPAFPSFPSFKPLFSTFPIKSIVPKVEIPNLADLPDKYNETTTEIKEIDGVKYEIKKTIFKDNGSYSVRSQVLPVLPTAVATDSPSDLAPTDTTTTAESQPAFGLPVVDPEINEISSKNLDDEKPSG